MLIVNEKFGINSKIKGHLPSLGSQFQFTFLHPFNTKVYFCQLPQDLLFLNYFGGFTGQKCFIEITSQLLCVLLLLTTGPVNLGETLL